MRWLLRSIALLCSLAVLPLSMQSLAAPAGSDRPPTADSGNATYAIAVHGGAGGWANLTPEQRSAIAESLTQSLTTGRDLLAKGGASVDAVEQAVRILEDAPHFNAGKGATFTATGVHQLDASIMNGADLSAGAVAGVTTVKNPISLARRVMTDTKHVLLAGDGAEAFAREVGVETVPPDYFWTDRTREEYEKAKAKESADASGRRSRAAAGRSADASERPDHYGTVGCVALDIHGNVAAATSTGGLAMKKYGRIGDAPIIGAGTYADNDTCAISGTGVGELFIRNAVCYDVASRMRYANASLAEAAAVQIERRLPKDTAGLIALNKQGEVVMLFNTAAMPRGIADSHGRLEVSIDPPLKQQPTE
jgi:L-asparaginase / beta-aspartyl-peptidase